MPLLRDRKDRPGLLGNLRERREDRRDDRVTDEMIGRMTGVTGEMIGRMIGVAGVVDPGCCADSPGLPRPSGACRSPR